MNIKIVAITKEQLPLVWGECSKHIQLSLEHQNGFSLESIYTSLLSEMMALWVVILEGEHVASATTCIHTYPECKEWVVVHLGGERMQEWGEKSMEVMVDCAKENGCSAVVSYGRKGTERMYKQWGYEYSATIMKRKV